MDDRYRELIAGGSSPEEATRLALAEFRSGNALAQRMASLRQAQAPITLGASTGHVLSDLWQDSDCSRSWVAHFPKPTNRPGRPHTVILTHGFWQRHFGGAPAVLGETLAVDGAPQEVSGVFRLRSGSFTNRWTY